MEEHDTHHKRIYCKPNDPRRCQAINKKGNQCLYLSIEGKNFCIGHCKRVKKEAMSNYLLSKYRGRIDQFTDNKAIYNIREELGMVRMLLETRLNKCETEDDLLMNSPAIADLVDRASKMVHSSVKLEEKLRNLLDVNAVNQFSEALTKGVIDIVDGLDVPKEQRDEILDKLADIVEKAMPKLES